MIEIYEKYKLKNGQIGTIIDILGEGEAFLFEIDKKGLEDRILTVTKEEIKEKIL